MGGGTGYHGRVISCLPGLSLAQRILLLIKKKKGRTRNLGGRPTGLKGPSRISTREEILNHAGGGTLKRTSDQKKPTPQRSQSSTYTNGNF